MALSKRMGFLDKFVTWVFLLAPMITILAIGLGVNSVIYAFSAIMFLAWIIYIYGFRASYQFSEEKELSFVERARGLSYIFDFAVTFSLNSIAVFTLSLLIIILVIPLVGGLLVLVEILIPKSIFFKEVSLFNEKQKKEFHEVISWCGSTAIYYSFLIGSIGLIMYFKATIFSVLIALAPMVFLALTAYNREQRSRKFETELVASLKQSRWYQRYENQMRAKILRSNRKNDKSLKKAKRTK